MTHLTLARCLARLWTPALAGLVALTGACETERPSPSEPESAQPTGVLATAVPSFASTSSARGVPFGFWRLEYTQLGADYTSLQANASASSIRRNLDIVRSRGATVFIRFAGGSSERYQNGDGSFSLSKFKALLDQFKNVDLDSYIADGTLAGHMLLDEPSDGSNWDGRDIPFQTLEDAAKHSKSLWPNLPTFVRSVPTWLAGASFRWEHLDGGWAQYSARKGQVDGYREAEVRAANSEGLKVVWGLNVLDGGDGSSKKRFNSSSKYSMSASEVLKYGRALLAASNSCGFLMWHYMSKYIESSGISDAMETLSEEAKSRSSSCGEGGGDGNGSGGDDDDDDGSGEDPGPAANAAPTARFTETCTNLSCAFANASSDSDGTIASSSWNYGDGSVGSTASHVYAAAGRYTVTLAVTDDEGATDTSTETFTVQGPPGAPQPNLAPVPSFEVDCSRLSCDFEDTSRDPDGDIEERRWSFGNGSTSDSDDPERTYAAAGTYTVTLTVTDDDDATATTSKEVSVSGPTASPPSRRPPNALFGSSCRGRECKFTDRSKRADSSIERWRWNFGDGETSSSRNPSYRFDRKGTYKVILTVTDEDGDSDDISHRVTVK